MQLARSLGPAKHTFAWVSPWLVGLTLLSCPGMCASGHAQDNDAKEGLAKTIDGLLQELVDKRAELGHDVWAKPMQQLILLDRPAVPLLIERLDQTNDSYRIRCLVFALRGIGDKRAIPALIRAIPKTLQPPMSDYGLLCEDAELLKFMKMHDTEPDDSILQYSFGRPISEVRGTLNRWTGEDLGYAEIIFVHREGGRAQQAQQERMYMAVAVRFADWWREHWQEYVDDPSFSVVDLPAPHSHPADLGLPMGPRLDQTGETTGVLASILQREFDLPPSVPKHWAPPTFIDLDTGRQLRWPSSLPAPEDLPADDPRLAAWAARNGIDIMGTEYRAPSGGDRYYAVKPFGLRAWELTDAQFQNMGMVLNNDKVRLNTPVDGLLAHYDKATGTFQPQVPTAFLFVTREGTCGTLKLVSQVTERAKIGEPAGGNARAGLYDGVRFSYRFYYAVDDAAEPTTSNMKD